jgi:hypothetical protein
MSHAVVPNFQLFSSSEPFSGIWKLTRTMLAAGWKYKASGDATGAAKDTSGNAQQDRWAVGGGTNLTQVGAQTGNSPTFGTPANGLSTITGLSGMSSTNSPGRYLVFSGAVNAGNNGTFRIVSFSSATSVVIFNPGAVSEVGSVTTLWTEKQGGAVASITASGTNGAIAGRATVSGLTGMVTPTTAPLNRGSTGDRLTIIGAATGANNGTFMITRVISATSVEIDNPSATTDANNGALIWVETSPLLQIYGLHLQGATGLGAWENLQGPSTMKIPIGTNTATGTFVKGEVINQTTSGAQGVIIGVLTDTAGGNGYVVVEPRISGTGGGPRGWTNTGTDTITGVNSLATLTTTSVPIEYVREVVIWKNTASTGHMWVQCVDQSGETASRFSTLAGNAGTTATICPGGATGTFPVPGSWVFLGTGGSNAAGTGAGNWHLNAQITNLGNAHMMCANCIEGSGVSADGTWIIAQGTPSYTPASYIGTAYLRMDDGEEGDVDPYVTWMACTSAGIAYAHTGSTRTTNTTNSNATNPDNFIVNGSIAQASYTPWKSFRRRGFPSGDAYQELQGFALGSGNNAGALMCNTNVQAPGHMATQATTTQSIRESIWLISTQIGTKIRKGSIRWLYATEGAVANTTYNTATWIQLSSTILGPVIAGPWDGTTIPTNA